MANILLVDEPVNQVSRQALEAMGHSCLYAKNRGEAADSLRNLTIDVLVCEIRDKSEDFKLFELARSSQANCRSIAIIADSLEEYFPELLERAYPHNFLADNRPIDVGELTATIRKLLSEDIFGIDKYEVPVETALQLASSAEKYPAIEKVRNFYLEQGVSERIVRNVELILNELLMNALFDAPQAGGTRPEVPLDRSAAFAVQESDRPTLTYGISPTHLAVSVSDPFGNLDRETFFSYLHRCFAEKSVLEGVGKGAGMGLFLVFKSLDQMVINVATHRRTEVIAMIDHRGTLGQLKKRRHSFHYFQIDKAGHGGSKSTS